MCFTTRWKSSTNQNNALQYWLLVPVPGIIWQSHPIIYNLLTSPCHSHFLILFSYSLQYFLPPFLLLYMFFSPSCLWCLLCVFNEFAVDTSSDSSAVSVSCPACWAEALGWQIRSHAAPHTYKHSSYLVFFLFVCFFVWYCMERTDKVLAGVICIQGDAGTCLLAFVLKGVMTPNASRHSDSDAKTDKAHAHM